MIPSRRTIPVLVTLMSLALMKSPASAVERQIDVLIVRGADGADTYTGKFDAQVKHWQEACTKGEVKSELITSLESLKAGLTAQQPKTDGALWVVLIGHGTYDGREAKFNLVGPDLAVTQMVEWVKPLKREVVVVNTASASGAFVQPLAGPKRVIVSATKSAGEVFYARFGEHMAAAINGLSDADFDQDQQVSLLEAFLYASRKTTDFYVTEGRIATEHSVIEDNGDGVGSRAEVFEGVRAKDSKADGARALQLALVLNADEMKLPEAVRAKRDALEAKVRALALKKAEMKPDDYYKELEALFVEIAKLQP